MGILASSSKGVKKQPPIILIYGAGGLGKDTFAAAAPKPYVIDYEHGTCNLDVTRHFPTSYDNGIEVMKEILTTDHGFQTLVVSGLDVAEQMLFSKIVKEDGSPNMAQAHKGYGNAYKYALEVWVEMQRLIHQIRDKKGMQAIIVAHELVYSYNDPTAASYDRYRIKLHEGSKESAAKLWFDFADIVLFAKKKVYQQNENRAIDEGKHYIYTQGRAAFDAKSRYDLPFEIELSYGAFESAMKAKPESAEDVAASILDMANQVKEAGKAEQIKVNVEKYKKDVNTLKQLRETVKTILQRS